MEYNTEREKIVISEYGRNIQVMIRHLMDIEDRKQRTEAAYFIVNVMAQMNPQVKESNDYMHKLWDHLHIIADYKLDVDSPYPVPTPEMQKKKPEHVGYQKNNIRYGHYGQYIYDVVKKVKEMEDGPKKQAILINIANQMKRDYLNWNRDTVNDLLILDDLYKISGEEIALPMETKLIPTNEILNKTQNQQQNQKKKNNNNNKKKNNNNQQQVKQANPNRPNKKN
ncbi:MAG: DUF4290 domain-containing protein [Bacteroidales bacterium]|nr:DUF4290 domain-containing protein [Bacteroidales bacterium]MBO7529765.1 DUF4290 domain-containing protein [Bacteroidales bacterium]